MYFAPESAVHLPRQLKKCCGSRSDDRRDGGDGGDGGPDGQPLRGDRATQPRRRGLVRTDSSHLAEARGAQARGTGEKAGEGCGKMSGGAPVNLPPLEWVGTPAASEPAWPPSCASRSMSTLFLAHSTRRWVPAPTQDRQNPSSSTCTPPFFSFSTVGSAPALAKCALYTVYHMY